MSLDERGLPISGARTRAEAARQIRKLRERIETLEARAGKPQEDAALRHVFEYSQQKVKN